MEKRRSETQGSGLYWNYVEKRIKKYIYLIAIKPFLHKRLKHKRSETQGSGLSLNYVEKYIFLINRSNWNGIVLRKNMIKYFYYISD